MNRGGAAAWVALAPLALSCGRTGLEDAATVEPPPLRYLTRDSHGDCQYGIQKTFLDRDGDPRALSYEIADPCPPGNAEHRWLLTTGRYVLTFPYWQGSDDDEGVPMLVLDADTLEELRRGGPFEPYMDACAVGESELWLMPESWLEPGDPTVWVVDLETLEVTDSFELPGLSPEIGFRGGCASDGDRAFVCALPGDTGGVSEVRLADHSIVDQDPLIPGVQGIPLPSGSGCRLIMDAAHSRLLVGGFVGGREDLLSIDLSTSGATEPRVLLPGDRSRVSALHPVVLPGGEVFALLEQTELLVHREEWIRIDPESGDIVSLREHEADFSVGGLPPTGVRALPAAGNWVVTLVWPSGSGSDAFGFEYFNAMTGEAGPSLDVDERPQELFPLPPRR